MNMSYNEAITIQRAQMVWYRQAVGLRGIRAIRRSTLPCPEHIHPDQQIPVSEINRLVPRGGSFEYYIKNRGERDETRMAWHEAIRRGLF